MFVSQDVNKTQRGVLYFLNILISKFLHRAATRSRHPSQGLLSFLSQPCTAPCIWICIIIVGFVIRGNVATWIVILVPSSFFAFTFVFLNRSTRQSPPNSYDRCKDTQRCSRGLTRYNSSQLQLLCSLGSKRIPFGKNLLFSPMEPVFMSMFVMKPASWSPLNTWVPSSNGAISIGILGKEKPGFLKVFDLDMSIPSCFRVAPSTIFLHSALWDAFQSLTWHSLPQ